MTDRLVDVTAERAVLGTILAGSAPLSTISGIAFGEPRHQAIAAALRAAQEDGADQADVALAHAALTRAGRLGEAGGLVYLADLLSAETFEGALPAYLSALRSKAAARERMAQLRAEAADLLDPARHPTPKPAPVVAIGDAVDGALDLFRRRHDGTEKPMPLPWPGVAQALGGGLWPGAHVLTGTTAAGKTAFAIQCAISTAAAGHPVLYIGLELDTAQIVARLASLLLGEHEGRPVAHWSDIYLGKVAPPEEAIREVAGLPLYVEEAPPGGWSARAMDARVKDLRLKHPGKTPLVVLDFLQLVGPSEPGGRREELRERIGAAAYAGRQVARTHGAVVLMLSSISRAGATDLLKMGSEDSLGSGDPAELVGLGKESGDIEFAADSVLCLAREPRDENEPKGPATIWLAIAKQRAGSPTWCCLKFNGSWHEEDRSATPATRRDDRARAKAKELEDRRQRDFERRLGNVIKVLEQAKDKGPLSVHYVCSKVGARPSGFVAYLQELEQRGLAHQVWFGRKSLGWAIGSGPQDAFPSVPISSGNASERTGTVCVPTAPCNGQGTHPASVPERTAEQKPPPPPRVLMTPEERAALIARAAQPDEYLEAMAAQPAEDDDR